MSEKKTSALCMVDRRKRTGAGIALVAALLSGCVTMGLEVTEDELKQLPVGTPHSEIVQKLGRPTAAGATRTGHRTLIYTFAQAQPHYESFIPLIGHLLGGAESRSSYAILELDDENKLVAYRVMSSSAAAATGFGAGRYQEPDRTQLWEAKP